MIVQIPGLLSSDEVAHCREALAKADWVDGKVTAGEQSAGAKTNLQVPEDSAVARTLGNLILTKLGRNERFTSASLAMRVFPPLFNRYEGGMNFGTHIDNAIRFVSASVTSGAPIRVRTDLSATLFLTDPADYDGGELVVLDTFGEHRVKLAAGDLVVYSATSRHHVTPVTRGARISSFFWVQSMVRDEAARTMLFELDNTIQSLRKQYGDTADVVALTGLYHNLVRRWAEFMTLAQPQPTSSTPEISTPVPARRSTFSVRRFLGTVHLWVGLICGIPFAILGFTGSMLMLGHDGPSSIASTGILTPDGHRVGAVIAAAQEVAPPDSRVVGYDSPAHAGDPALVRFAPKKRDAQPQSGPPNIGQIRILVDPVSLAAKADAPQLPGGGGEFMRAMHDLHGRMMITGPTGRNVVGWLGVFMVFLGLSGIVLWWPKPTQIAAAFTFRFSRSGLKFSRDLHGAVGIWGLIVFVIVSFSGVVIAFPQTLNDAFSAGIVVRDARANTAVKVTPVADAEPLDVDGAVELARGAVADGIIRSVTVPSAPDLPYRIALSHAGEGSGAPRTTVYVDQWTKQIAGVRDPATYAANNKFLTWQRPLHAGNAFGWLWWTLVFVSGFLPLLFVITGASMWFLKRRNRRRVMAG